MRRDRQWRKRGTFIPSETKNIRKITCKVCGKMVYPKTGYVVRDRIMNGGINAVLAGNSTEAKIYDAMDCPECGCQMVLKERMRKVTTGEV